MALPSYNTYTDYTANMLSAHLYFLLGLATAQTHTILIYLKVLVRLFFLDFLTQGISV